ncbi:efflux RND transporter periplasmic adaptor subunit [Flammeovirga yaeyamensis]|uniref:Efflux RND transporter periplasmic adaptor subunit n=1 Tax=Flammeovirga yaeyamensis TaxID=367791 RepID=A0AAX1NDK7_9BACT|nr:efflux RND transporter periplasmic adaptor subunit [Flammeovirga yaeyamensis]MBB3700082.1 RND family efflux transporter MFP subunit [Flammeovirga yaeyamensis]NMF37484.1 efflux RND transporter periplasmic adaptor subunit [Flammeovirga yaeyamensis]QWG04541.1 efflux RND transporter periplasmic adaptor subunit [Flammeovirga yaeyamensis]
MKKYTYISTLLITFLGMSTLFSCSQANDSTKKQERVAIPVKVQKVKTENVSNNSQYAAEIKSDNIVLLSTKLMGRLYDFNFEAGDVIKKGTVIARIESAGIHSSKARVHAQVEMAEVNLQNAEKDYQRIEKLHQLGSATDKELDDIRTYYLSAKAQLEVAKNAEDEVDSNLSYTTIRAPFTGVITKKMMVAGDMASPGMPIVEFASASKFKALANIPASKIDAFEKGNEVMIYVDALQQNIKGTVKRVVPSGKYNGGQFTVEFSLNQHSKLANGMYAKVSSSKGLVQKILLPENAIYRKGQLEGVYLVNLQNEASLTWVRLGKTSNGMVEVLSGAEEGDQVITTVTPDLFDGALINF